MNPAKVKFIISGEGVWTTIRNGEYLKAKMEVDFENSAAGLRVDKMECFLGNIKIASENASKCEICYKIDNMLTGEYEFRIEAEVYAPGYDKTVGYCFIPVNITD